MSKRSRPRFYARQRQQRKISAWLRVATGRVWKELCRQGKGREVDEPWFSLVARKS